MAAAARAANGDGLVAAQGAEGAAAAQSLIELVWACGGDPLALDDAGSRAAGAYLERLAPALAPVSAEAKFDSMTTALGSDRVALGANWAVVAADLLQRGGKRGIGVYAGPAGPSGNARLLSGQVLVAPAKAAGRAGALALARYLWSRPVQEQLAANLAWTPMRTDAFDAAPEWQRPVATIALGALRAARALPPLPDRDAANAALSDAFRGIAFQQVPPAQALDRAASRLRALR